MCFRSKLTETLKPRSPRVPFRRHHREPMKPRLSRKIVSSAKVNLNAYWSQFEELSKQTSLLTYDLPTDDWSSAVAYSEYSTYQDNEINDNLVNELMELGNK